MVLGLFESSEAIYDLCFAKICSGIVVLASSLLFLAISDWFTEVLSYFGPSGSTSALCLASFCSNTASLSVVLLGFLILLLDMRPTHFAMPWITTYLHALLRYASIVISVALVTFFLTVYTILLARIFALNLLLLLLFHPLLPLLSLLVIIPGSLILDAPIT